jgi:hypothetical protein
MGTSIHGNFHLGVGLALEDRECGALRVGDHREAPGADFGGRPEPPLPRLEVDSE